MAGQPEMAWTQEAATAPREVPVGHRPRTGDAGHGLLCEGPVTGTALHLGSHILPAAAFGDGIGGATTPTGGPKPRCLPPGPLEGAPVTLKETRDPDSGPGEGASVSAHRGGASPALRGGRAASATPAGWRKRRPEIQFTHQQQRKHLESERRTAAAVETAYPLRLWPVLRLRVARADSLRGRVGSGACGIQGHTSREEDLPPPPPRPDNSLGGGRGSELASRLSFPREVRPGFRVGRVGAHLLGRGAALQREDVGRSWGRGW